LVGPGHRHHIWHSEQMLPGFTDFNASGFSSCPILIVGDVFQSGSLLLPGPL
jgi:hypothetical protein